MKKVVFLVLAAVVLISCNTQVPIDVTGTWSGSMTSSGAVPIELGLVDSGGAVTGSMRYTTLTMAGVISVQSAARMPKMAAHLLSHTPQTVAAE